jgi:hypothetical protein
VTQAAIFDAQLAREWQWNGSKRAPKNLPFTATPADAFLVHKHKSGIPLRSTASWKCPVAVRRNTAIPDGDTSALGAGRQPTVALDEMLVIRAADLDQVLAMIHGHIDARRDSTHGDVSVVSCPE